MTRRSLFKTLISAAAGSVLAKMPLAGFKDTTPRLNTPDDEILAYKDPSGNWVRSCDEYYITGDAAKALDEFFAQSRAQREDETFLLYQRGDL